MSYLCGANGQLGLALPPLQTEKEGSRFPQLKTRELLLDHVQIQGKDCLELGVQLGLFSKELIKRAPHSLTLVDPWHHFSAGYVSDANHAQADQDCYYQAVLDLSRPYPFVVVRRQTSLEASQTVPNQSLDFVYIDANHAFEFVLADLFLWYPKLRTGGWLCGHDYDWKRFVVPYAVRFFCNVTREEVAFATSEQIPPSFAIQVQRPSTLS